MVIPTLFHHIELFILPASFRQYEVSAAKKRVVYKVVLLGSPAVGKTSLRHRYLGKGFQQNYMVTLGADFAVKRLEHDILQIWDLAGQQIYKAVRSGYYKGAQGVLLAFDVTRQQTFLELPNWIDELLKYNGNELIPMVLVGNKSDLRNPANIANEVKAADAKVYAQQLSDWSGFQVPYIESSALTGDNVDNIFQTIIEEISFLQGTQEGH